MYNSLQLVLQRVCSWPALGLYFYKVSEVSVTNEMYIILVHVLYARMHIYTHLETHSQTCR